MKLTKTQLISEIKKTLDGIDQDECEYDNGWWETSYGAEFGKNKLDELIKLIEENV
jgi:hypothetical protein